MPKFIRVRSKLTGHEHSIPEHSLSDAVTVIDEPAGRGRPLPPKPNTTNPSPVPPDDVAIDVAPPEVTEKPATRGRRPAGDAGTSEEGSQ